MKGLVCGAESISNSFEDMAATMITLHHPKRAWVLDKLRRQFDEHYKQYFGAEPVDIDETYNFDVPGSAEELVFT
jgi:hypothetical protein